MEAYQNVQTHEVGTVLQDNGQEKYAQLLQLVSEDIRDTGARQNTLHDDVLCDDCALGSLHVDLLAAHLRFP